jgi:sugar phosphate isomerase/epimerase
MNRRHFIAAAAAAAASSAAPVDAGSRPPLCIFSKHMAQFNYDDLGKNARQIGFDGIDLTVRPKGHVLPERAAQDLPRAVDALRSHGLSVPMITTDLTTASHPAARPTLATAARLKIPYWKIGYYKYKMPGVEGQLAATRQSVAGLVALARETGVQAGFHNHSGDHIGTAVWDIRSIIGDMDPKWIGYYFDPGHARIEGGLFNWRVSQDIVMPRLKMLAVKDFYWSKDKTGAWKPAWCPMGEGMVDWPAVFKILAGARFTGPVSLHLEYETADELAAIQKDYEFTRKLLSAAYA